MAQFGYVHRFANGAKAQVHDVDASYKDLTEICRAIRGKTAPQARRILDDAVAMKKAIPYRDSRKGVGHRSDLGGKKGRYPKKECKIMLDLLANAVANAKQKGLAVENLFVAGASANRVGTFKRYRRYFVSGIVIGYGKQGTYADYETAKAEIHLLENKQQTKSTNKTQASKNQALLKNAAAKQAKAQTKPTVTAKPEHKPVAVKA